MNVNFFNNKYILSKGNNLYLNLNIDMDKNLNILRLKKTIENKYSLNDLLKIKINLIESLDLEGIEKYKNKIINLLYLIDIEVYILLKPLVDFWSIEYYDYLNKKNDDNSMIFTKIIKENYMNLLLCYIFDKNTFKTYYDKTNQVPYSFLIKMYPRGKEYDLYRNIQYYLRVLLFINNCLNDYMIQNNKFIGTKEFISKLQQLKINKIIGVFIDSPINTIHYKAGIDSIKKYIILPSAEVTNFIEPEEIKNRMIKINKINVLTNTSAPYASNISSQSASNTSAESTSAQPASNISSTNIKKKNVSLIKNKETNNTIQGLKNFSIDLEERVSKLEQSLEREKNENYKMLYFIRNQAKFFNTHLNNYANYQSYIIKLNKRLGNTLSTETAINRTIKTVEEITSDLNDDVEEYMKTYAKRNKKNKNSLNRFTLEQSEDLGGFHGSIRY